jgi:hypothetical protein
VGAHEGVDVPMSDEELHNQVLSNYQMSVRIAAKHLLATGYFGVGDEVLYGKWKNKRGIIKRLFKDEKGNPSVEIEPVPKGRKQNKILTLFKIWHADLEKRASSRLTRV